MKVKIKDHDNLIKDTSNGAILNTDKSAIARHNMMIKEVEKEKRKEDEINRLKSDISEIKALLQKLIQNG